MRATETVYHLGIANARPYAFWLFGSPVAFLVALGLPIAWFALRSRGSARRRGGRARDRRRHRGLLGFTKAETERI